MGEAELAPAAVRHAVLDRDNSSCRICGLYLRAPALHHIAYRSAGGADTAANLITLCWLPGQPDCHLQRAHRDKRRWQPILEQLVDRPGVTGLQLVRWQQRRGP